MAYKMRKVIPISPNCSKKRHVKFEVPGVHRIFNKRWLWILSPFLFLPPFSLCLPCHRAFARQFLLPGIFLIPLAWLTFTYTSHVSASITSSRKSFLICPKRSNFSVIRFHNTMHVFLHGTNSSRKVCVIWVVVFFPTEFHGGQESSLILINIEPPAHNSVPEHRI